MKITIDDIVCKPFTFTHRPELLPCEMRPLWRCSLILVIFVLACKHGACSLKKIHAVNWILKSDKNSSSYERWVKNQEGIRPDIRMDPMLDKAINLLLAQKLLVRRNDKYVITDDGLAYANNIISLGVFKNEAFKLSKYKKDLTEKNIDNIFRVR